MISNFQHLKLNQDKTPMWFINFIGQRSYIGTVSPYLSFHTIVNESLFLGLEPYATFTFGKTSYDQVFEKAVFYPNNTIHGDMIMRFYGIRVLFGIGQHG